MKRLEELKTEDLLLIQELLNENEKEFVVKKIGLIIERRKKEEEKSTNERMTIEFLRDHNIIQDCEYQVLKRHNIKNIRDLKEFDMSKLTLQEIIFKEDFETWAKCLDFDDYDRRQRGKKPKK